MSRPIKTGLEYFPKDTGSFSDRKIRKLLNEFGSKGYTIFDYLLCVIYSDKGYYVRYDDELAFDVADFLGDGITEGLVKEVVTGCIRLGLFSKSLYDMSNILTSSGIQKRYLSAKRNGVIDARMVVNTEETNVLVAITQVNTATSTQSKGEKSKGEEIQPDKEDSIGLVLYNAEEAVLSNPIKLEQLAMHENIDLKTAKKSLHKYHLYLEEKEQYPKSRKALFAGFEKWLSNEKNFTPKLKHRSGEELTAPELKHI